MGIPFQSLPQSHVESYLKFLLEPNVVTALTDANCGPQDQSISSKHVPPP